MDSEETDEDHLRGELNRCHEQLTVAHQELRSTNEELRRTNEELQNVVEVLEAAEEQLSHSSDQLQDRRREVSLLNGFLGAVVGSLSTGLAVVDGDLEVLAWNARSEDLLGVRAEDAVGRRLWDLATALPVDEIARRLREPAPRAGPSRGSVLRVVDGDGGSLSIQVSVTEIEDRTGTWTCAALVIDGDPPGRQGGT